MTRPRPPARCAHVASGARPHKAHGYCGPCYEVRRVQARGTPSPAMRRCTEARGSILVVAPGESPIGAACPITRCGVCGRRIGGGACPRCAPDRAWLLSDEERRDAAWARGMPASARPVLLRSEYTWAAAWCLAHGWAGLPVLGPGGV